jgi:hypothetical protein
MYRTSDGRGILGPGVGPPASRQREQLGGLASVCETNSLVQLRMSLDFVSGCAEIVRALGRAGMAPRPRVNGR